MSLIERLPLTAVRFTAASADAGDFVPSVGSVVGVLLSEAHASRSAGVWLPGVASATSRCKTTSIMTTGRAGSCPGVYP